MKKIVSVLLITLIFTFSFTGCKSGNNQNKYPDGLVKYDLLLNTGSCFVYAFQDPETEVWYLSTSGGITPRLNEDGSLYSE